MLGPREEVHGLPAAIVDAFSLLYSADVRRRQNVQGAPRLRASSRCRVHPRGNRPPMRRLFDDGGSCARSPWNRIDNEGCMKKAGSFSMVESSMATPPWLSLFRSSLSKLTTNLYTATCSVNKWAIALPRMRRQRWSPLQ